MSGTDLRREIQLLAALADENRLRLIACLLVRQACVCELVQATGLAQPRISRHLKTLRDVGLVRDERVAQWVEYSLPAFPEGTPEAAILTAVAALVENHPQILEDRERLEKATREGCST